jgi:hypothetical protein
MGIGVVLLALAASLAALAATDADDPIEASLEIDVRLVVLVNRLELDGQQMAAMHAILTGIASTQEQAKAAREALHDAFEAEMIAFEGTSEELDECLAAFREQTSALQEEFAESREAMIEALKETLTFEQGEILMKAMPQLLGAAGRCGRSLRETETEPEGSPVMVRRRAAHGNAGPGSEVATHLRERIAQPMAERFPGGRNGRAPQLARRACSQGEKGPDVLGMLIEILELKMQ